MESDEIYKLFFQGKQVPEHCFDKVKLFDHSLYDYEDTKVVEVPLSRLVGTDHMSYGDRVPRWIDMLTYLKKRDSISYSPQQIGKILAAPIDNVLLAYFPETNEYYIYSGGNHRMTFHKLSGITYIKAHVTKATKRQMEAIPEIPSGLSKVKKMGFFTQLLYKVKSWL